MKRLLTIKQVADILQVHEKTVSKWARNGRLTSIKIGGQGRPTYRFDPADVEAFLGKHRQHSHALSDNLGEKNADQENRKGKIPDQRLVQVSDRFEEALRKNGVRPAPRGRKGS